MAGYKTNVPVGSYTDYELRYVNKGYVLEFFHIPTGKVVQFKAMITDFKDQYTSEWTHETVYGRMDPISNFKCTKRIITLGWDVVAASLEDAQENLQRVTLLLSMLYPAYSSKSANTSAVLTSSPLFRLTFVNLIKNYGSVSSIKESSQEQQSHQGSGFNMIEEASKTPITVAPLEAPQIVPIGNNSTGQAKSAGLVGSISGFTYAPNFEHGVFDPGQGFGAGKLYPQEINLSCEFTVFHTHELGWTPSKEFRSRNFPYGEPIKEISIKSTKIQEAAAGGTQEQKNSKANDVFKSRKR